MKPHRDLIKHTVVYGAGQIISRFASFLLLPLYTSCLSTADYGCLSIIDLTAGLLTIVVAIGMSAATHRYHFDANDPQGVDRVWWTGATMLIGQSLILLVPLWFFRHWISRVVVGEVELGPTLIALSGATIATSSLGDLFDSYFRVHKWSVLSATLAVIRLLINVGLNVWLLVGRHMGVEGVLWGNLATSTIMAITFFIIFIKTRGAFQFDRIMMANLWKFGLPLIPISLSAMVMHQADRFILRAFLDLGEVGKYSLAYAIGQAVNSLVLIPFVAIWQVVIYDIAKQPNAKELFVRFYSYFSDGLMLLMLAVSLSCKTILSIMAGYDYQSAANVIPVICLAYVFFSLTNFYNVPALLQKQMHRMVPHSLFCALFNIAANVLLVPYLGVAAAAWISVATFFMFAAMGYYVSHKMYPIAFPMLRTAIVMIGLSALYVAFDAFVPVTWSKGQRSALAIVTWAMAALAVILPSILELLNQKGSLARKVSVDQ